MSKHIITLPDHGLSNAAAGRSKHWIKRLDSVDTSKADGYAFVGNFVRFGEHVEVPAGTWFMSLIEDRRGSGKLDGRTVTLYQVSAVGELEEIREWAIGAEPGWALVCRDAIADLMKPRTLNDLDDVDLRAERAELIARLVDVHRRTLAAPARINYGDALDLSLRTGGVASIRRHGRRVGLAVVNGHLPDSLDPDEAEEVALSLLAAGMNGLLAAPGVVEVADDARAARLRTAYETGNYDGDGGPR